MSAYIYRATAVMYDPKHEIALRDLMFTKVLARWKGDDHDPA